jgi:hypothetical protein
MTPADSRRCITCREVKERRLFYAPAYLADGRHPWRCKACTRRREKRRKAYVRYREERRARRGERRRTQNRNAAARYRARQRANPPGVVGGRLATMMEWIRTALAAGLKRQDIRQAALAAGFSSSTFHRASNVMGLTSRWRAVPQPGAAAPAQVDRLHRRLRLPQQRTLVRLVVDREPMTEIMRRLGITKHALRKRERRLGRSFGG